MDLYFLIPRHLIQMLYFVNDLLKTLEVPSAAVETVFLIKFFENMGIGATQVFSFVLSISSNYLILLVFFFFELMAVHYRHLVESNA